MATYKKKGSKPSKEKLTQEEHSTTAEVFNTLDETASKSEQWVERNSKSLFTALLVVGGLILAYFAYDKFVTAPKEKEAADELAYPKTFFDQAEQGAVAADSLFNLALNGADGKYGLIDIIENYGGTDAGNLAKYMAGISYLRISDYENAIIQLNDFSTDDEILGALAKGNIGDAFAQINQPEEAIENYIDAANFQKNDLTSPFYLFKAGILALNTKDYAKATKLFKRIKEEYPTSDEGLKIDAYINRAKLAQE
ncbi:tetratricopeptide repeat protein [Flavobacteriaceae bacterium F08102]|nr:tetratricopeptide repeat protein [Flavobacteriaceae bacterium F08102]